MAELKDSGARRNFNSGAVRDIAEGKGRADLLPLDVVAAILDTPVLDCINDYVRTGDAEQLNCAILHFIDESDWEDFYTAMLEASKQYEDGARKYSDRNWEKGMPVHCFIDSGVRHYLKYRRGDTDEPHDRAVLWNLLGAIWTHQNKPELIDLPFKEVRQRKVIYIAHPFQGKPENVEKVEKIILDLIEKYPDHTFYSPLHATGFFYFAKSYEEGMKDCIEMLSRSDEVWLCPGWQSSKGCNIEMNWCKENGKPFREL